MPNSRLVSALEEGRPLLCTLCSGSHTDGPHLSQWCLAKARCTERAYVAHLEATDLSEMIQDLLIQWKVDHSAIGPEDLSAFRTILEQKNHHLVAVHQTNEPQSPPVRHLVESFVGSVHSDDAGARIFVLLSPNAEVPVVDSSIEVHRVDGTALAEEALQEHLTSSWGLSSEHSGDLIQRAIAYQLLDAPGMLYTLIDRECRAWSHEDST